MDDNREHRRRAYLLQKQQVNRRVLVGALAMLLFGAFVVAIGCMANPLPDCCTRLQYAIAIYFGIAAMCAVPGSIAFVGAWLCCTSMVEAAKIEYVPPAPRQHSGPRAERLLLRGADQPAEPIDELLRAASPDAAGAAEELVRPCTPVT